MKEYMMKIELGVTARRNDDSDYVHFYTPSGVEFGEFCIDRKNLYMAPPTHRTIFKNYTEKEAIDFMEVAKAFCELITIGEITTRVAES